MFFILCVMMALFSTVYADQRIHVPIIVDNLSTQDPGSGVRTFNITAATGNTSIAGSLGVTGAGNFSSTLTTSGIATIYDDFVVRADDGNQLFKVSKGDGTTTIATHEVIGGTLTVDGATTLNSLGVTGNETIGGTLGVTGATLLNSLHVTSNEIIDGTLGVTGATTMSQALDVAGDVTVNADKFKVRATTGNTSIAGTLTVAGSSTLAGNVGVGGSVDVTGNVVVNGILHANGGIDLDGEKFVVADTSGNTTIAGRLDVRGTTSFQDVLAVQNNVIFGTRVLADAVTSTTSDLLQITLPDINNYIGIVDVTYVGDMADNNDVVSDLEIFSTRYLVSRMDKTLTATVARIAESYYNAVGGMGEPAATSSVYAKSLACEYTHAASWVPNARAVTLRYLPPTQKNRKTLNATVLYEIRSGGPTGGPLVGLSGLWAR